MTDHSRTDHPRSPASLADLLHADSFADRHLGPDAAEVNAMLAELGLDSLEQLLEQAVPAAIRNPQPLDLPAGLSEREALNQLHALAGRNQVAISLLGMGYSNTLTPPVIQRNVLENPGWYTAYTPYQPEVAQGRLEGLLNFQQMIMDLTGLELANASLLDEATAAAEAMAMCKRAARGNKSERFFVDADCHPQTIAVLRTRADHFGFDLVVGDPLGDLDDDVFGALLQYPGSSGQVRDFAPVIERLHANKALAVMACDLLALVLLQSPGSLEADIAVGSAQRFGVPLGFGGPHAAFFACRERYKRAMPGRIIGVSVDARERPALRMALQTREQHIRREKANSNICTSQVLLALMAVFYAIYHGPERLRAIAERVQRLTSILQAGLAQRGFASRHDSWFDTLTLAVGEQQASILHRAEQAGINLRRVGTDAIGISLDETSTPGLVRQLWQLFDPDADLPELAALDAELVVQPQGLPTALLRRDPVLTHAVFNRHHSETEMLRYLRRLERRDIALDRSMIPLGSCTMKLNATAEMLPVTWPEFSQLHPFAPLSQAGGYLQLFDDLEAMLAVATGYDAVSLQPNAGSQGEYAGLLAIKAYHASRGEGHRDICLIPSSAHGTNPASAQMAGMRVVVVHCDEQGNVDLADLREKAARHAEELAAIMVTYPSTHGVFEEGIGEICRIIHDHGGQVYVDGANLNALVGVAAPGGFGADVSHINLHKTFCIPHGGGGPGMGPIGVKAHLAPFLPNHPVQPIPELPDNGPVSAAPWGSAGILPISWMYMKMMGGTGLTRATEIAILNANYIAQRLQPHFPVLYRGRQGWVAHECLIDLRPLKAASGVTEEDIAKRLMDFGYHAPTMSFPVAGTLMIEPTESESKAELDRFCEAMIQIRSEIAAIERGDWPADNNPLCRAPHSAADLLADWDRPYPRELAFYPLPWLREDKYWPPVNRVDNVYGDRNLVCSCPPLSAYMDD